MVVTLWEHPYLRHDQAPAGIRSCRTAGIAISVSIRGLLLAAVSCTDTVVVACPGGRFITQPCS